MTLTWSWSGNASNESMSKRLGLDTSPTTKLKSSKLLYNKLHLPRESIIILVIHFDVLSLSKPKSSTHPIQARPELPCPWCHSLSNSCPAQSYWSSRLPREPERNTRHQRSGSETATSKMSKETELASDQPRPTYESTWHSLGADLEMLRMKACQRD